jgi:hypothetical protein
MTDTRDQVRRTVVSGARLLHDTTAGLLDAVRELADPRIAHERTRQQELQRAQRQGRWLSDAEQLALERSEQARQQRRRMLLILLLISVVLPPLWLLAPVWAGLLWWPHGTRRLLGWAFIALGLLVVGVAVLLVWLLLR